MCREDKMDSPIHTNCIQSGGATTLIFIVDEADAVGSFVTRSTVPWNKAVPPDGIKLAYEFLRMSASHSMLLPFRSPSFTGELSVPRTSLVSTRFSVICSQQTKRIGSLRAHGEVGGVSAVRSN